MDCLSTTEGLGGMPVKKGKHSHDSRLLFLFHVCEKSLHTWLKWTCLLSLLLLRSVMETSRLKTYFSQDGTGTFHTGMIHHFTLFWLHFPSEPGGDRVIWIKRGVVCWEFVHKSFHLSSPDPQWLWIMSYGQLVWLSLLPRLLSVCFNFRVLLTDFASFKPTLLPAVSRLIYVGCTPQWVCSQLTLIFETITAFSATGQPCRLLIFLWYLSTPNMLHCSRAVCPGCSLLQPRRVLRWHAKQDQASYTSHGHFLPRVCECHF